MSDRLTDAYLLRLVLQLGRFDMISRVSKSQLGSKAIAILDVLGIFSQLSVECAEVTEIMRLQAWMRWEHPCLNYDSFSPFSVSLFPQVNRHRAHNDRSMLRRISEAVPVVVRRLEDGINGDNCLSLSANIFATSPIALQQHVRLRVGSYSFRLDCPFRVLTILTFETYLHRLKCYGTNIFRIRSQSILITACMRTLVY